MTLARQQSEHHWSGPMHVTKRPWWTPESLIQLTSLCPNHRNSVINISHCDKSSKMWRYVSFDICYRHTCLSFVGINVVYSLTTLLQALIELNKLHGYRAYKTHNISGTVTIITHFAPLNLIKHCQVPPNLVHVTWMGRFYPCGFKLKR